MSVTMVVVSTLLVFVAGAAFWGTHLLAKANARVEAAKESVKNAHDRYEDIRDLIGELRRQLKVCSDQRAEEAKAYMERAAQYENRISELIRQNQNLAERVASLRQSGFDEGGEDLHVEDAEPEEPWSAELQEFYEAIEIPESQDLVEEFIQDRRSRGMADEQILRQLEGQT